MARNENIQPHLAVRVLKSAWFKVLIFVALLLLLTTLVFGGMGTKVQASQLDFLEDAVRRSAVQCYALEGRFPDNLTYLEDNYGLIIDHKNYAVYYESMGDNLIPQIRVIPLTAS